MSVYYVTSVDGNGTTTTTAHQTLDAAEKALDDEKSRLIRREILGVAMDQQESSGTIHPIRALMTDKGSEEDVFINTIKSLRRSGYPSLQDV